MKVIALLTGVGLTCALLAAGLLRSEPGAAGAAATAAPPAKAAPKATPRLGINLASPTDWGTELPFTDLFRSARAWLSQKEGAPFGGGPALSLDAHGWVTRLEPGAWAETVLSSGLGAHLPSGDYTIAHEGQGELELWGGRTTVKQRGPGRVVVHLEAPGENIFLRLKKTSAVDPVRKIRVYLPGFSDAADPPWHPGLLARWKGMAVVRFMDFQQTNGSKQHSFADRPTAQAATFAEKGVPIEWMVDLANRLGADPWFCLPHEADDAYVRGFAELVKARLEPGRRVWIEYSNEVWNAQFPQHGYAVKKGRALGLAKDDFSAGLRFTARRSVEIFAIWERVFGGAGRLRRVLPAQAANAEAAAALVGFEDAYKKADALAVAPYFGIMPTPAGEPGDEQPRAAAVHGLSVEELLGRIERTALPIALGRMKDSARVAAKHGLLLVAYEAGQHLVGVTGAENDDALTALFSAANRHPRMGALYQRYLDGWVAASGDLLCHFSSVSRSGKWGHWGLLEYFDDDPKKSPKLVALLAWARGLGQAVTVPR